MILAFPLKLLFQLVRRLRHPLAGEALKYEDIATPTPKAGQILIKVLIRTEDQQATCKIRRSAGAAPPTRTPDCTQRKSIHKVQHDQHQRRATPRRQRRRARIHRESNSTRLSGAKYRHRNRSGAHSAIVQPPRHAGTETRPATPPASPQRPLFTPHSAHAPQPNPVRSRTRSHRGPT